MLEGLGRLFSDPDATQAYLNEVMLRIFLDWIPAFAGKGANWWHRVLGNAGGVTSLLEGWVAYTQAHKPEYAWVGRELLQDNCRRASPQAITHRRSAPGC